MKRLSITIIVVLLACVCEIHTIHAREKNKNIKLPAPAYDGKVSLEKTLHGRRSRRDLTGEKVSLKNFSQILWAAQGVTNVMGFRTAPSAGALYPLEIYAVVGNVGKLKPGVYRYNPARHSVKMISKGDKRSALQKAALHQSPVGSAALDIIIAAAYERTTRKYGERGVRYVHIEVGHAAQNVALQCESLDLGTVTIGAFEDEKVKNLLGIDEAPLYIMPVGHPR